MDRLARSLVGVISMINQIAEKEASIVSLTEPGINTTGPHGKLILHVLGAVAEYELGLIRERTRAGLEQARLRNAKLGRPRKISAGQSDMIVKSITNGQLTQAEAARRFEVSPMTIQRLMARSTNAST
ncbi:DNA resolvase [Asaia spathodeae NBRC 105894]|nr:DNA resolvase [Asaia spathodeae NBRC 105894]